MAKLLRTVSSIAIFLSATQCYSFNLKEGHLLFEAGAYTSNPNHSQDINIQGLIGNRYTANHRSGNALFGLGYLVDGIAKDKFNIHYGINAFYLVSSKVSGTVTQELMFTNLAYSYEVSHLPIYATAKADIKTSSDRVLVTLDAGVGPNFIKTTQYKEWSLDGITLPDHAFRGTSNTQFSAMAGIGLKFANLKAPVECGYRFFYLGEGTFNARTNQILNNLETGTNYAQALLCTVTV